MENMCERIHKVLEIAIGIIGIVVTIISIIVTIISIKKSNEKE